jgi:hypothetical protein
VACPGKNGVLRHDRRSWSQAGDVHRRRECTKDRSRAESAWRGAGQVALRLGGGLVKVVGFRGQLVRGQVGEQNGLFGGSGRRERRPRGRQLQVGKDLGDNGRIADEGQNHHRGLATGALQGVDVEDPAQKLAET